MSTIIIFLNLLCLSTRYCKSQPKKLVIDTDPGGDDALAIMLALMYEVKTHDIEILAITATYGNTYLKNAEENVLKILTVANRSDIPVYGGSQKPLLYPYQFSDYFGKDGFGDFNFTREIIAKIDKSKHASVVLVELIKQYPDEITIVTLGPLTTIATAIALEPNFLHLVKHHVVMGSNIYKNIIEYNFSQDPESNWITFNNTNKPITVLPIETVASILKEEYRDLYSKLDHSIANFLQQAERISLEKSETWLPADGITMAAVLQPEIITESFETKLIPILVGDNRGSVALDNDNKMHNANVIKTINITAFKNFILQYLH